MALDPLAVSRHTLWADLNDRWQDDLLRSVSAHVEDARLQYGASIMPETEEESRLLVKGLALAYMENERETVEIQVDEGLVGEHVLAHMDEFVITLNERIEDILDVLYARDREVTVTNTVVDLISVPSL
jgi:hypothetical protein